MALVVELAEDQLCVQPIHRLILGASGNFIGKMNVVAEVEPRGRTIPRACETFWRRWSATESLGLVAGPGLALLKPRLNALRAALERLPDPLWEVDTAMLELMLGKLYAQRET